MDGEISRDASRFLVRRLGADEELCATWARYHVVRDCLRNPDGGFARDDLCSRVRDAIEQEEAPSGAPKRGHRWFKPVAGAAIAASVALVAVLSVDPGQAPSIDTPATVAGNETSAPFVSPQVSYGPAVATQAASAQSIDRYLLRHYQATGGGNARGFVGFVPVLVARPATPPETPEEQGERPDAAEQPQ